MTIDTSSEQFTFQKTTLDNGLRILTSEMPHTRSVSISLYVGVGSRYESDEEAGISHFIEHMLFKGTESRPTPQEISGVIEETGGIINAGTEHELTVYWCKVAHDYMKESIELFLDMVRNPTMEADSIEKERLVVIEELSMVNDYPNYKVDALIDEMLWPSHPLGRDIGGSKETVTGITRQMLVDHMTKHYTPSNIVISVAGNVSHEEVVDLIDSQCNGWKSAAANDWKPFETIQSVPVSQVEYRPTEQAHLSIAVPGYSMFHPDRYALDLLSVILGEGMSSRLFVEVREVKGLAYDVHSGVSHFLDTGAFVVSAGVDPTRIYEAVETILEQISSLKDAVTEEELNKAKQLSTGRLQLRMEDTRAVSSWMGSQEMLLGHVSDFDEVVEHVKGVSLDNALKVANEILVTDRLNMAVVGPCRGRKRLEKLLKL